MELCREDVDLSKSITNPFDPLLIVRDPYNSRIIKIATLHSYQESILECICFFGGHHFELDVDVSSWLKMKARHW